MRWSAGYTTNTSEFEFSVHTGLHDELHWATSPTVELGRRSVAGEDTDDGLIKGLTLPDHYPDGCFLIRNGS